VLRCNCNFDGEPGRVRPEAQNQRAEFDGFGTSPENK
jgi:hypothetical protein